MRFLAILSTLLLTLGCSVARDLPGLGKPAYDPRPDVELFLSTSYGNVENQVLERLKQNNTSHQTVKKILRETAGKPRKGGGLQLGLQLEHNNKKYPYALYIPDSNEPGKVYPLIVVLHGLGGSGDSIIQTWVKRLSGEFAVLCPSYPMGAWWSKTGEEIVLKLIREVRAAYAVDYNRVFLAGLSNGAIGAYITGMFYPDYFAGILTIAGSITERYMHFLVNLVNTPIYIIQGVHDPIFPIDTTRRVHQILSDLKSPIVYREHREKGTAHGGHYLPESEIPAMVDWLKAQRRTIGPSVIRMTREENHMDRIHWVRLSKGKQLAALQLPGPERETLNVKDGKIATLFAVHKGKNRFEIMGKNLLEYEVYLNDELADFDRPVVITTQEIQEMEKQLVPGEKVLSFHRKVERNMETLLSGFKALRDPELLFDARIKVSVEKTVGFAFKP
ncbi:MAG: PHB depolymerase family esterase [Nitrospinaceae bacterium]